MEWIIYCHRNKINNKRYIGQTCRGFERRCGQNGIGYKPKQDHTTKFYNAIQKYGWDNFEHIILEQNIKTLDEANQKEKFWIAYYDTYNNDEKGYNMTPGGESHQLSEEAKKKQIESLKQLYKNNPELITYQREKQAELSGKPVYCFEQDRTYISLSEAARENNVDISAITRCLLRKKQLTTNGLHWKYADDDITIDEIEKTRKKSIKRVLCEETKKIYNSPKEAAIMLGLDNNAIAKCCRGVKKSYHGYHWRYIDE